MEITYNGNKVERRFTTGWAEVGTIKAEEIVSFINASIAQRKAMVEYIEALHNELDSKASGDKKEYSKDDVLNILKAFDVNNHYQNYWLWLYEYEKLNDSNKQTI